MSIPHATTIRIRKMLPYRISVKRDQNFMIRLAKIGEDSSKLEIRLTGTE
jgi:hypothetical protein